MIHDIAVVGTGPIACSLALRLGAAGFRTALIGPSLVAKTPDQGFDARILALSASSVTWLKESRLWAGLAEKRVAKISAMQVANPRGQTLSFYEDATQESTLAEPLAYIVEHANLIQAASIALKFAPITQCPNTVERIEFLPDKAVCHLSEGGPEALPIEARLVIGADGADSLVRRMANITMERKAYQQHALVANLVLPESAALEAHTAYQWFTGDSVLALLPLPGRTATTGHGTRVSIVWSCAPKLAQAHAGQPIGLVDALANAIRQHDPVIAQRLAQAQLESPVMQFPLAMQTVSSLVAVRTCLVGDAAHVVHPLAGQGMNLGFGDAASLFSVLSGREPLRDLGDEVLLRRYARQRAQALAAMRVTTDGLVKAFDSSVMQHHPLASGVRDWGWQLLDSLPWAKNKLIAQAMR